MDFLDSIDSHVFGFLVQVKDAIVKLLYSVSWAECEHFLCGLIAIGLFIGFPVMIVYFFVLLRRKKKMGIRYGQEAGDADEELEAWCWDNPAELITSSPISSSKPIVDNYENYV